MTDQYVEDYLVTGALGWGGRRLVRLLATGFSGCRLEGMPVPKRIRCLVMPGQDASVLTAISPIVEVVEGDIRDEIDRRRAVAGMEGATLIHTAGVIHPKSVKEFFDVNRDGGIGIARDAASAGFKRAVMVSSNSPIGNNPHPDHRFDENSPYNPYMGYGRSKMEMELGLAELHKSGQIEVVVVRPPWFYGPDQPPRQTLFFTMIKQGKGPVVGTGNNYRSMVHVDNLAQGLVLAAIVQEAAGKTYWIADERPYTMNEIIDTVERLLERDFNMVVAHKRLRLPSIASEIAGIFDYLMQSVGVYNQKIHVLSEMNKTIACDIASAKHDLGYSPTRSLERGMRESIADCLASGQVI
ncbi:NAD-dependent epimerase/dehydratase family protein [Xanthomonas sacchari]|uniref:NAD-dependent epimerase/dehydratase family protein n=1 Tax=Xanthomonas sacchari TaxID=56458 RepID=UPI00225DFE05|nr:NAD(P)-dependent oxidoreductase [Xanthomonas sacchari]MCW0422199.1 N-acetyl-alpha-D-glucosaminyl-diphospho-ditrans,octacis-undecaprenol 4-epimerase [Xanthomonas sacchari]